MTDRYVHRPPARGPEKALPARPAELLEIVPCALMEVSIDAGGHRVPAAELLRQIAAVLAP